MPSVPVASPALVCQATTGATGLAQCSGVLPLLATTLSLGYTASFAGDTTYLPASASGTLIGL